MTREQVYNFSAGPSVLPESVLQKAAAELTNFGGSGMSVMEMSHRSKIYVDNFDQTKQKLKDTLGVPDTHEILFLQGGATLQFAMAPMNLMGEGGHADYAVTGSFAAGAMKEAKKYGAINIACSREDQGHTYIPAQSGIKQTPGAAYFYYCANNTIFGTQWSYVPETAAPLVCDMSSEILSKPADISKYGIVFAGAQKNMAPAGLTVVIIDKSLAGRELPYTPVIMNYKTMIEKDSMYNTPPCYNIYMLSLVLDWIKEQGGVDAMNSLAKERSGLLYDYLENSRLFKLNAKPGSRSLMNVAFRTGSEELDAAFVKQAAEAGLLNIKGHRSAGGMRASCYNAMPIEGVKKLIETIKRFEVENRV
jgi:phosphoserine aminotransferase